MIARELDYFTPPEVEVDPEVSQETFVIAGLGKDWDGDQLSKASKMTALAVALDARRVANRGGNPLVIFSGGHTKGPQYPSEGFEMYTYVHPLLNEQEFDVILEDQSYSTETNGVEIRKRLENRGFEIPRVDRLVTLRSHTKRGEERLAEAGVTVGEVMSSEEILDQYRKSQDVTQHELQRVIGQLLDVEIDMYEGTVHYLAQYPLERVLRMIERTEKGKELLDKIAQRRLTSH